MKTHILAIGAHPDDVELGCGGILAKHVNMGYVVGVLDLTQGELGTRGTAEIRAKEAQEAANILGIHFRENLNFKDGFFNNDETHQLALIQIIRKYQPDIVLANAPNDRHPDHGRAAQLVVDSCFLSGLPRIVTTHHGSQQQAWRPKAVYHYIQAYHHEPDIVIDISAFMDVKMNAIKAYKSQFYNPESNEPETLIAKPEFLAFTESRALQFGIHAGFKYAEGLLTNRYIGISDIMLLE